MAEIDFIDAVPVTVRSGIDIAPTSSGRITVYDQTNYGLANRNSSGLDGRHPSPRVPDSEIIIDAEWRSVAPQEFESGGDYTRRQWSQSDERLIRDLEQIDRDYDEAIRRSNRETVDQIEELERQRQALNTPTKSQRARVGQRLGAGVEAIGAAVDGFSTYSDRRGDGAGLGEALGAGIGRAIGGVAGGTVGAAGGATAGATAAVAVQGPVALEPVTSLGGAGIGGAIGGVAGGAIGGEFGGGLGEAVGGAIGQGIDNLVDWLTPGKDGAEGAEGETGAPIQEGDPEYDGSIEGAIRGGQCPGVRYNVYYDMSNGQTRFKVDGTHVGPIQSVNVEYDPNRDPNRLQTFQITVVDNNPYTDFRNGYSANLPYSFYAERSDGQPDTCGNNPAYEKPGTKTRLPSAPTIYGGVPPLPDLTNPFKGNPFGRDPSDIQRPTNGPNPDTDPKESPDEPIGGLPPGRESPFGDIPTGLPDDPNRPDLDGDGSDGGQPSQPPAPEVCDPCAKIDELREFLKPFFEGEHSISALLEPCEEDENGIAASIESAGYGSATAFEALRHQNQAILDALVLLWEKVRCEDEGIPSLPEIFLAKAPSVKPQCQIQFKRNDQGANGSRWHLTIPHFDQARRNSISLPSYVKGNVLCTLELADNTKIMVNAKNAVEGRKIISACLSLVERSYRVSIDLMKESKIPGRELQEVSVKPCYAKYFAGRLDEPPLWVRKLD